MPGLFSMQEEHPDENDEDERNAHQPQDKAAKHVFSPVSVSLLRKRERGQTVPRQKAEVLAAFSPAVERSLSIACE